MNNKWRQGSRIFWTPRFLFMIWIITKILQLQTAIFIDSLERYKARFSAQLAYIIPDMIRQKAIDMGGPIKRLMNLLIRKEASPYGYASMEVRR